MNKRIEAMEDLLALTMTLKTSLETALENKHVFDEDFPVSDAFNKVCLAWKPFNLQLSEYYEDEANKAELSQKKNKARMSVQYWSREILSIEAKLREMDAQGKTYEDKVSLLQKMAWATEAIEKAKNELR